MQTKWACTVWAYAYVQFSMYNSLRYTITRYRITLHNDTQRIVMQPMVSYTCCDVQLCLAYTRYP